MLGLILRRKLRRIIAPLLGMMVVGYFAYHAVEGPRGLEAYLRLTQEVRKAEISRDLFRGERDALEKRVRLLRPDSLDPDLLEERARLLLSFGHADDQLIMLQRSSLEDPVIATR